MPADRPYPWHALESVSRETPALIRIARDLLDGCCGKVPLESAASQLIGRPCTLRTVRLTAFGLAKTRPSVAVLLRLRNDTARVLIVAEAQLAARIASVASGRPCPLVDPLRPAPDSVQGAFAAFVLAAARRAARDDAPVLVAVAAAAFDAWRPGPRVLACEAVLTIDQEVFPFSALVELCPRPTLAPSFDLDRLRSLGDMTLSLCVDAGATLIERSELAGIRPGDVIVPDEGWAIGRTSEGLAGDVLLRPSHGVTGLPAKLIADGRIVLGEGTMTADADMPTSAEADCSEAAAQVIGEVPVLVRIEIGQVSMTARQWAATVPGEIVKTTVPIADPVVLRIAGREVARGELVDIEGKLGVRVTQLARCDDGGTK